MTNIWCEEELDSLYGSFHSQSSNEEDGEDHVRQCGGDVHSLREEKRKRYREKCKSFLFKI